MPTMVPPKKNTQFITYIALVSQADTKLLKSNPTIAVGDFKASTDGGALANLGTLPTVTPASSTMVKITMSTSEMNGDNATLVCIDAAGAEWCDAQFNFQTSARQVEDLAFPLTSGRGSLIGSSGHHALDFAAINLPAGPVPEMGILENGTPQAATTTTVQGRAGDTYAANDAPNSALMMIFGSTEGYWQARLIIDYNAATKTYTIDTIVQPTGTLRYIVFAGAPASSSLPFPVNIKQINDTLIQGTGAAGDRWRKV